MPSMFMALIILLALQRGVRAGPASVDPSDCGALTTQVCNHFKDGVQVTGKLVWPSDKAPAIVDVDLEDDSGLVVDSTKSGPGNLFRFDGVKVLAPVTGSFVDYYIVVNTDGLDIVRQQLSLSTNNFTGAYVSVPLRHPPGVPARSRETVTSFDAVLRATPKGAFDAFDRAMADERKGDLKKAAVDLQAALTAAPDFYEANLEMGLLEQRNKRYDDASRLLSHAIEINPASMRARVALGQRAFDARKFDESAVLLGEAAVLGSAAADVYLMLGSSYYETDRMELAESSLERALAIAPGLGQANRELYAVYLKRGEYDKALAELQTYLKRHPSAPDRDKVEALAQKIQKALHP